MSKLIETAGVGQIELNELRKNKALIIEQWDKLGFTEGLEGHLKETIATLYENQAKLIRLQEATDSSNSGSFETVVFPIIRRVFSRLLANDIVSVQAMNLPIGKLFFILPVTSERQWSGLDANGNITDGSSGSHTGLMGYERADRNWQNSGKAGQGYFNDRYSLPDEIITSPDTNLRPVPTFTDTDPVTGLPTATSVRNRPVVTQYFKTTLYDLFYNDFLFDNSKGKCWIKAAATATPVILNDRREFVLAPAQYPVSQFDGSISNVILEVTGFSSTNAGRLTGPDGNEMDTETFTSSLKILTAEAIEDANKKGYSTFAQYESIVNYRILPQKYGQGIVEYGDICTADGKLYIEINLTKPTVEQGLTMNGYIGIDPTHQIDGSSFIVSWAQYDSLELETEIGEVSFKIANVVVSVEERKLRATWSPELAQDVAAFHNIDAEAELTALLSEQIAAEVDREILRDLRHLGPWQRKWDVNGWKRSAPLSTNYTQKDWNQDFVNQVNIISGQIHKATLKGGANYIVVSSEINALLNNLEYFHVTNASAEAEEYNMGIEKIGTLQGRYKVYVDPYSPHDSCIIGHKGTSLLDTGYIYAPYIPLSLTPVMYNVFNMSPVRAILTRYAKKAVNNKFYGHIHVDGLVTWNTNEFR
jgi:hypothetical protein